MVNHGHSARPSADPVDAIPTLLSNDKNIAEIVSFVDLDSLLVKSASTDVKLHHDSDSALRMLKIWLLKSPLPAKIS